MWIKHLSILNFKNIAEADIEFSPGINCITGLNGMGKSNLLEAVWYLSMTRSFLRLPDTEVIRRGQEAMMLRGDYGTAQGGERSVVLGYTPPRRKVLKVDGKEYRRMSAHIGMVPIVMISPSDHFLITGAPEDRRRLMDTVISQADALYLEALIRYEKALTQRNSMLRAGMSDPLLLEAIELNMETDAATIYAARKAWVEAIREPFERYYTAISAESESPTMQYTSVMSEGSLRDAMARSRAKDEVLGYTTVGVHRDDLLLLLCDRDLRRFGSQGQMKTYTIALRMAIYEYIHERKGVKPILLLDDIFDKLDAHRVEGIMRIVSSTAAFGQIFITDTGRENIDAILHTVGGEYSLFDTINGSYAKL